MLRTLINFSVVVLVSTVLPACIDLSFDIDKDLAVDANGTALAKVQIPERTTAQVFAMPIIERTLLPLSQNVVTLGLSLEQTEPAPATIRLRVEHRRGTRCLYTIGADFDLASNPGEMVFFKINLEQQILPCRPNVPAPGPSLEMLPGDFLLWRVTPFGGGISLGSKVGFAFVHDKQQPTVRTGLHAQP
jgi:hypothetical protein